MRWDPTPATSNICDLKIATLKNGKLEDFLKMMKNFKTAIDREGTTTATGRINYICSLLLREYIR